MLEEETSKINPDTKTRKLIHILTEDLVISCKNNVLKLNEINKTFGFKVEHLQITEDTRKKRQIIVALIALCSVVSVYSISQLTSMAVSSDDELVTSTNHIINAIESHENRITRSEENVARLMKHIRLLQKELYVLNDVQMTLARIFSIKTQAIDIRSHLDNVENGLYNLIRGTLTPYLVNIETLQKSLDELSQKVTKFGYQLSVYEASEAIQMKSSFVSLTNGTIVVLLHIPIYRIQSALYLYVLYCTLSFFRAKHERMRAYNTTNKFSREWTSFGRWYRSKVNFRKKLQLKSCSAKENSYEI